LFPAGCVCYINYLPVELLEMLLMRAAAAMLASVNKTTSRDSDVTAVTSLLAVSRRWYEVFAHRLWNQKQLRRALDGRQQTRVIYIEKINIKFQLLKISVNFKFSSITIMC